MTGSFDDDDRPWGGDRHASLDVRELLEEASWPSAGPAGTVEPEGPWAGGRRRRTRKRAGAGLVAGVAALAVAGLVWQTEVFGGTAGEREPHVATVPSGMTTFVLAGQDAPDVDVSAVDDLGVPSPEDLVGTSWVLTDQVYGTGQVASQLVGSDAETVFSFAQDGWGFLADGCAGGGQQGIVDLDADGAFPPQELATDDQDCGEPAQTAEDFWLDALAGGGSLHLLGDGDYLLLSVDVPGGVAAPEVVVETAEPDPSADPAPSGTADPGTEESTGAGPTEESPSQEDASGEDARAESPSGEGPRPDAPTGGAPSAPGPTAPSTPAPPTQPAEPGRDGILAGFTPADEVVTSESWPDVEGGQLFAPTVRAGLNDGYDRVVVDLTGTGTPSWYGSYPEVALRDGSGAPVQIAGDSVLELVIGGAAYPEPGDPVYDDGDFGLDTHRLDGVEEVIRTTPWEGQLQLFVGVRGEPRPYRVFLLQDPMRLVVDVQHAG